MKYSRIIIISKRHSLLIENKCNFLCNAFTTLTLASSYKIIPKKIVTSGNCCQYINSNLFLYVKYTLATRAHFFKQIFTVRDCGKIILRQNNAIPRKCSWKKLKMRAFVIKTPKKSSLYEVLIYMLLDVSNLK